LSLVRTRGAIRRRREPALKSKRKTRNEQTPQKDGKKIKKKIANGHQRTPQRVTPTDDFNTKNEAEKKKKPRKKNPELPNGKELL